MYGFSDLDDLVAAKAVISRPRPGTTTATAASALSLSNLSLPIAGAAAGAAWFLTKKPIVAGIVGAGAFAATKFLGGGSLGDATTRDAIAASIAKLKAEKAIWVARREELRQPPHTPERFRQAREAGQKIERINRQLVGLYLRRLFGG